MGKPKYQQNQILKDKATGEIYFIKKISYSSPEFMLVNILYVVVKINLFNKELTLNESVRHWLTSTSALKKRFYVIPKKQAKTILTTTKLLYSKET